MDADSFDGELVPVRVVRCENVEGLYVDDTLYKQGPEVTINDLIGLPSDVAIHRVRTDQINLKYLDRGTLPEYYEIIQQEMNMAHEVDDNRSEWEQRVQDAFTEENKQVITKLQLAKALNVPSHCAGVLIHLLTPRDSSTEQTLLGNPPVLKRHAGQPSDIRGVLYRLADDYR